MSTAPSGLGPSGRRLWKAIDAAFELTEAELTILRQAARCADSCDALEAIVAKEGVMMETNDGLPRAHPALIELRQQRLVLGRLLVALRVPEDDDGPRTPRRAIRGFYPKDAE